MSQVRWQEPNLARAPFVNERPVRRLAVTLWVLFAIVGGLDVWQSRASRLQTSTQLAELVRLNRETVQARERAATLERELRAADLPAQNERTEFLNRRLAERAFSWSSLLESLTQVMPRGVRLVRLSPEGFASEQRRAGAKAQTAATTRVALRITGEAEETEALLEFVDRLFQHPAFDRPNLARESEKKDLRIQFDLAVAYLPEVAGELAGGTKGKTSAATSTTSPTTALAAPSGRQPGALADSGAPSGAPPAPAAAGAAGNSGLAAAGKQPAPAAAAVASRQRPGSAASAWGDGRLGGGDGKVETDVRGGSAAAPPVNGGRFSGVPVGGVPAGVPAMGSAAGGGFRPGSQVPPAAAPPGGSGSQFPNNVMPTPLRPYASSTGGGR